MSPRERLLAVLAGEKPDKTPWFADLSYLYDSMDKKGELSNKYRGDSGYLQFYKELGAGIYLYPPQLWCSEYTGGIEVKVRSEGNNRITEIVTPKGTIRSISQYLPKTFSTAYVEHFVKTIEDLKVMLYIFQNTVYRENYEEFIRVDKLWGNDGIAVGLAPIPVSPIQKLLTRWAGVENTVAIMMDNMEEFDYIIEELKKSENRVFDIIVESPAKLICFPENLSSEITGRMLFNKYSKDYYKKRVSQLHKAGKFILLHIDGTLRGLLPLLGDTGVDIAEAVTPAPVGDVPVEELREVAGDDIIIWGGIPGALFSPLYSDEYFERYVRKLLEVFPIGSKFVLGVADQVPPDGLISRVRKVKEIVEKW